MVSIWTRGPFDLTGYYKLYAVKKTIRIVYRIHEATVIVEVVAIGKREDLEVYKAAFERIFKGKKSSLEASTGRNYSRIHGSRR